MLAIIMIILYLAASVLWGIYSLKMQKTMYPDKTTKQRTYGVLLMNVTLCPIAIYLAHKRFDADIEAIKQEAAREAVKEYVIKERMG
jgi:uncharacterized membrane protein (DUF485 family)